MSTKSEVAMCPLCGGKLQEVRYPSGSILNREQFMSVRAGDYYCEHCKGTEARTGYKYFWERELAIPPKIDPVERRIAEAVAQEREAWRNRCDVQIEALIRLWKHTTKIDNGTCAVCRIGYRSFDTNGNVAGKCSDYRCLSHLVEAAITDGAAIRARGTAVDKQQESVGPTKGER